MNADKRIERLIGRKQVYFGDHDYNFLSRKQYIIAFLILVSLKRAKEKEFDKHTSMNSKGLFSKVQEDFEEYVKIGNAPFKAESISSDIYRTVLFHLRSLHFLTIIEHGSKKNQERGIHTVYEISISQQGLKCLEEWSKPICNDENEQPKTIEKTKG
jgi:hypothetical protein